MRNSFGGGLVMGVVLILMLSPLLPYSTSIDPVITVTFQLEHHAVHKITPTDPQLVVEIPAADRGSVNLTTTGVTWEPYNYSYFPQGPIVARISPIGGLGIAFNFQTPQNCYLDEIGLWGNVSTGVFFSALNYDIYATTIINGSYWPAYRYSYSFEQEVIVKPDWFSTRMTPIYLNNSKTCNNMWWIKFEDEEYWLHNAQLYAVEDSQNNLTDSVAVLYYSKNYYEYEIQVNNKSIDIGFALHFLPDPLLEQHLSRNGTVLAPDDHTQLSFNDSTAGAQYYSYSGTWPNYTAIVDSRSHFERNLDPTLTPVMGQGTPVGYHVNFSVPAFSSTFEDRLLQIGIPAGWYLQSVTRSGIPVPSTNQTVGDRLQISISGSVVQAGEWQVRTLFSPPTETTSTTTSSAGTTSATSTSSATTTGTGSDMSTPSPPSGVPVRDALLYGAVGGVLVLTIQGVIKGIKNRRGGL